MPPDPTKQPEKTPFDTSPEVEPWDEPPEQEDDHDVGDVDHDPKHDGSDKGSPVGFDVVVDNAPKPPAFSDEALALAFTGQHKDELRYVAAWGRWMRWDGARWKYDQTLTTFDRARAICREMSSKCNEKRLSMRLAEARTVAAVERLARSDRHHAATADQWDSDPWILNTPHGVVDLKTGDMRAHRRDDHLTKITVVGPGGDCPLWREFLERVTAGDSDLQLFLQRVFGYALTGCTHEHAFFFLYGTGANGKTVLLGTASKLMGDYAMAAPIDTFIKGSVDRHPTELAGLRGARLVVASETEEGRRWAESRIKAITGGDTVSARFMRQDFFEYTPAFKLIVAGNHRPGLRSVDEAIRRRMNLIPFTVTIPVDERDEHLSEKLEAEWPGILEWMIAGCLDWQERGLDPPEAVVKATDEYLETEDALSAWIAERCETKQTHYATSGELFKSWKGWAEAAGEHVGSQKRLSQNLQARGFEPKRQGGTGGRGFEGISVKPQDSQLPL